MGNYKKREALQKTKKLITAVLAVIIAVAILGSGLNGFTNSMGIVNAGGRTGDYGIREKFDDSENNYPNALFDDGYFDANGNITIEIKKINDADKYTLLVQDETNKKVYINGGYWALNDEYSRVSYFIINSEKLVKCDGRAIVLNKSDFKKNAALSSNYGDKYSDVTIGVVKGDIRGQWYQGFWFDANGEWTYKAIGSWKGSGDWQWYEDTSGWYPTSCWQKMDKLYDSYYGNGQPACASASSRSWGSGRMYVQSGWFYFDENGYAVKDGWHKIDGSWYYFDNFLYEGTCWRDGYYIGSDGIQSYAYTGSWKGDSNGWWFEDTSGWYPSNEAAIIDGTTYYFKSNGYMAADEWLEPGVAGNNWDNRWVHVNSSGVEDKYGYYDENNKWCEEK